MACSITRPRISGVAVGDGVRLGVKVIVGDNVTVAVYAGVKVPVAVAVALALGVVDGVWVGVVDGVGVRVGVGVGTGRRAHAQPPPKPTAARRTPSGTKTNQLLRMRPILNSTPSERKEYFRLSHERQPHAGRLRLYPT
ncbi:MAG TPA: hypothetical protein VLD63_02615 [Anaerolineales bacterium]|nr:hypothetical protein [Anaerolineales bacterium]